MITTDKTFLYYSNDDGMVAVTNLADLVRAHNADLVVGPHAYAGTTTWVRSHEAPASLPAKLGDHAAIGDDWVDWVEQVFEAAVGTVTLAEAAQQVMAITDAGFAYDVNAALAREEIAEMIEHMPLQGLRAVRNAAFAAAPN